MINLNEYIKAANHSTEKWLIKNYPEVYDNIIEYCKDIQEISYKQKLWHYQNQIPNLIKCANKNCNNQVNFKGRWTTGYYKYCCQKCSIEEVEYKKSLLNYSRVSKLTKEEKLEIIKQKEINKKIQQETYNKNRLKEQEHIEYYKNISIEEYLKISKNQNGLYVRESFVIKHMPHIYNFFNNIIDGRFDEKIYYYENKLDSKPLCKCGKNNLFINRKQGYRDYCSKSCAALYGADKAKETFFNRTGHKHHSTLPSNLEKRINIKINRVKDIIKDEKLFISFNNNTDMFKLKCDKCNKIHYIHNFTIYQRQLLNLDWRNCVTNTKSSNPEKKILEYVETLYKNNIILNSKRFLNNNKEIDIYLPDIKIGIEHNGLFWHNEFSKDNKYHHDKWKSANEKGIKLIQIYGDEWLYKQDIVKSRLKNIINNKDNIKIYARKCEIRIVKYLETKEFLIKNHLQGSINSSINYGLYYNDELVSIMTFGKPRKGMKYVSNNSYELYRFCSKLYTNVIGGAGKLFNHFIKNHLHVNEIYSFSSLEWPGEVYEKIGMKLKSISKYSYWYIEKGHRISRHKYTKHNLIKLGYDPNKSESEILKELKIVRIYGPGNKTFVWNRI